MGKKLFKKRWVLFAIKTVKCQDYGKCCSLLLLGCKLPWTVKFIIITINVIGILKNLKGKHGG